MGKQSIPTIDATRHEIARQALHEVQVLALKFREAIASCDDCDLAVFGRGIMSRISALSDIAFQAVIEEDGERESVGSLKGELGYWPLPGNSQGDSDA